jgi:hypothetical protein
MRGNKHKNRKFKEEEKIDSHLDMVFDCEEGGDQGMIMQGGRD